MEEFMKFPARKSRTAFVVDEILRAIREGRYHVGDQLPPERILAEQFGVGRAAIREALSALSTMSSVSPSQKQRAPRLSCACFSPSPGNIQLQGSTKVDGTYVGEYYMKIVGEHRAIVEAFERHEA